MNTTPITLRELVKNPSGHMSPINKKLADAAITVSIANGAIEILSVGKAMRAGEIADAIGEVGIEWNGTPCKVSPQAVGKVMRRLVNLGRVQVEEVEGDPIEIQTRGAYDWATNQYLPGVVKTITPKTRYYSLV